MYFRFIFPDRRSKEIITLSIDEYNKASVLTVKEGEVMRKVIRVASHKESSSGKNLNLLKKVPNLSERTDWIKSISLYIFSID